MANQESEFLFPSLPSAHWQGSSQERKARDWPHPTLHTQDPQGWAITSGSFDLSVSFLTTNHIPLQEIKITPHLEMSGPHIYE